MLHYFRVVRVPAILDRGTDSQITIDPMAWQISQKERTRD